MGDDGDEGNSTFCNKRCKNNQHKHNFILQIAIDGSRHQADQKNYKNERNGATSSRCAGQPLANTVHMNSTHKLYKLVFYVPLHV
jgi:hypothetical protein